LISTLPHTLTFSLMLYNRKSNLTRVKAVRR